MLQPLFLYIYIDWSLDHTQNRLGDFLVYSRKVTFPYFIAKFVFNHDWLFRSHRTIFSYCKIRLKIAARVNLPYSACWKYFACFAESTSGEISSILGSG